MTICSSTVDQVNIMSQLADHVSGNTTAITAQVHSLGEYVVAIADFPTIVESQIQCFNRDIAFAFDGTNYWFGYALWIKFPHDRFGPVALTYNGDRQKVTMTAYTPGSPRANQIWGMRVQNSEGYYLIQSYNYGDNEVMDIQKGVAKPGTPIITFHYNGGKNQHWQYRTVHSVTAPEAAHHAQAVTGAITRGLGSQP